MSTAQAFFLPPPILQDSFYARYFRFTLFTYGALWRWRVYYEGDVDTSQRRTLPSAAARQRPNITPLFARPPAYHEAAARAIGSSVLPRRGWLAARHAIHARHAWGRWHRIFAILFLLSVPISESHYHEPFDCASTTMPRAAAEPMMLLRAGRKMLSSHQRAASRRRSKLITGRRDAADYADGMVGDDRRRGRYGRPCQPLLLPPRAAPLAVYYH